MSISTATGELEAEDLGIVLPHEHLFINLLNDVVDGLLYEPDLILQEVLAFRQAGGTTIVDVTTAEATRGAAPDPRRSLGAPREERAELAKDWFEWSGGSRSTANVLAVRDIAERTGLNIILGTGHYRDPYLDPDWINYHKVDEIAALMVADIVEGIAGTGVRAGIIGEVGADSSYVSAGEERALRAAARAQLATGVGITTHALRWPVGLDLLDVFEEEGVDLDRVVVGHCDMVPISRYHLEIARRGAFVQFDTMRGHTEWDTRRRLEMLADLWHAGFGNKVLVSQDICRRGHLKIHGGEGYDFLLTSGRAAALDFGFSAEEYDQMLTTNARHAIVGG